MKNPYYFTDRLLQVGFKITLESHLINHAKPNLKIKPNYPEFGIEIRYTNKIKKELSVIYARLRNQYIFKNQTAFSAIFDEQGENNQKLDETDTFNSLNSNHNITETDIDNIYVKSPLEHQIQQQEMKDSGWRFDKIKSMILYFHKAGELNGSNYVKTPLRSNAILNFENTDKYCFFWSLLASLHLCIINHPNRVSNFNQYFIELNIQDFDFNNGFKSSDVHRFNEINNLSINIFEI